MAQVTCFEKGDKATADAISLKLHEYNVDW